MTFKTTCRAGLLAGLIATLAACGNDDRRDPLLESAYESLFGGFGAEEQTPITDQQVGQALAATDRPVIRFTVLDREAEALAVEIERNGAHRTYATADRQAIVLRNGLITATRGLGGDLMSVEEDRLLGLLRGRSAGQATYVQRYLTPEDVTEALSFTCTVTPGQSSDIAQGVIRTSVTVMQAACSDGQGTAFTDSYLVDGSGEIVTSKQWLGETTGYATMQQLRR
ncbi:YjbF family lipoprotein [Salipiger mangrovisoli]|uniref:YjbF family lipoprotein n=1 Tax=Salipiger mangrovisoli TaxID=2865933 RepID=A0ABR9WXB8_9RHOB|nr:YjbF family lipoprotein [Salipiger mangrovisoli]MBE9635926.1 YjbF family lipoprotein [Salipiger mangrovisoli]